jgi:flagellar basal-body rod protein FlgB
MHIFDGTIGMLEKSLAYTTAKNQAIAGNIANVDTPGYRSKDVVFKNVLHNAIMDQPTAKRTHPEHLPFSSETISKSFQTIHKANTVYNHNGNNVDTDKEMAELAKNQIYYQGLVDRLNGKFSELRTVIRGGK